MHNIFLDSYSEKQSTESCIGLVVDTKEKNSSVIEVYCPKFMPFHSSTVDSKEKTKLITTKTSENKTEVFEVHLSSTITAEYFGETNRSFPPDVHEGEQVQIVHIKNTDLYFWSCIGRDDTLRKNERFRIHCANEKVAIKDLTDDNTYYLEISTFDGEKYITLSTSDSDSEKFRYALKLHPDSNVATLQDNTGNEVTILSEIPSILMKNRDGAMIDLNQRNIIIVAPDDVLIKSGRQTVIDTPNLLGKVTEGDGVIVFNSNSTTLKSSDSVHTKAPSIGQHGAVQANNIVAGPIQATGYSTGSYSGSYESGEIDYHTGSGTNPANSPDYGGGGLDQRHCAAWEQVHEALNTIADCFDTLGLGCNTGAIRNLAAVAKMPKNRGE